MSSVRWPTGGANWQSQQLSHTENRTMKGKSSGKHSWWWDSHNTPKNSKWLEDNLNDMDSKVKAMLRLIEEDADSFAKRAEMYYKKRPELVGLVEEFYRAYRSLAERYDQLTGHIKQIPQEIQAQFGFSGDAPPGSPVSAGSVRRRAAGFSAFASPGTPKRSHEKSSKGEDLDSSSSSSDSENDTKHSTSGHSEEIQRVQEENEQLRKDLDKEAVHHQALEVRILELQEELKALQHQNGQLHRNAASAHSEIAALEAAVEKLKKENVLLGEEASMAARKAERFQKELDFSREERNRLTIQLGESGTLIKGLEAKIIDLEAKILQLTEDLLSSNASREDLQKELIIIREERSTLLIDVSVKATRIRELEEEIANLQASLTSGENQKQKWFELQQSLEKQLADLHIHLSFLQEEKGKLSGDLVVGVERIQSLEQQLKDTEVALQSLGREKSEVAGLLSTAETSLSELQDKFGSLQEKLKVETEEKHAFNVQIKELQSSLEALHGERNRGVELQDLLEKRFIDLEEHLKQVQAALEVSESEKADVSGLLSKAESNLSDLQAEFGSMQENLNMALSMQAEENQGLKFQLQELQAALESLQGERERGFEVQGVLEKRLMDFEQQLKEVQEALELSMSEKEEVGGLLGKAEDNLSALQIEFDSMQQKLNEEITLQAEEKQALTLEVQEFKAAVDTLQGHRSRGLEVQGVLEKRIMDLEQQLEHIQAAFDMSEKEKAEVRDLLNVAKVNLSELQGQFNSMQQKLNEEISLQTEENQVLKQEIEELQVARGALQGEQSRGIELQDVLENRFRDLEQHLKQVQETLALTEKEKEEVGGLLSEAESNLSELQSELVSIQEKFSEEISLLSEEKQLLKLQLEELQAMLEALHDERSRAVELQHVWEKRLIELEELLKQFQEALELAEKEKEQVGELLNTAKLSFADLQGNYSAMQEKLNAEVAMHARENHSLKVLVEELQSALAALHGARSREVESQNVLEKHLLELQHELLQARQENSSLTEDLANKDTVLLTLEGDVSSRDNTIGSLQADLFAKQEDMEALSHQLEESFNQLHRHEIEIQNLRALLGESEDLTRNLEAQVKEIKQEFELERMQADKLTGELQEKIALLEKLEGEVQNRDMELTECHEISSKLRKEADELQKFITILRQELAEADLYKQGLDKEIEFLVGDRANLAEEKVSNLDEISKLKNELEGTFCMLEERAALIAHLELEMERINGDLNESNHKIASYAQQIQVVMGKNERLERELALLQEANSQIEAELASKISYLEKEKSELVCKVEDLELIICKLEEEIKMGHGYIEDFKVQMQHILEENTALEVEIQGLREKLIRLNQSSEERTSRLSDTITQLKVEIERLEANLSRGIEQLKCHDQEQVSWDVDRARLQEGINRLTAENKELQKTILMSSEDMEKLKGEHTTLQSTSREVESSLLFHQGERGRLESELAQRSERIYVLEEELKNLQLELINSQAETRKLSVDLEMATQELKVQLRAEKENVRVLEEEINHVQQNLLSTQGERETMILACQEHVEGFHVKEGHFKNQIGELKGQVLQLDELCKELARNLKGKSEVLQEIEASNQELHRALLTVQHERDTTITKCDSLNLELAQEHGRRIASDEASAKFQAEIERHLGDMTRLEAELQKLKEERQVLNARIEDTIEQERLDAVEIAMLMEALHGAHEENGSPHIGERSWHAEGKHSALGHLKESMLNLLTDRSKIKQEAAAHAERVKMLDREIEQAGLMLDATRGEYQSLTGRYDSIQEELQAMQLRIPHLEKNVSTLEEENKNLHEQLLASVRDSDEVSAGLLREKKELYEKLVTEGEHVLRLQHDLKVVREETVANHRDIDYLRKQIEGLLSEIQEIGKAKEEQEKSLNQEIQHHVEEQACIGQRLSEALGALSTEKAEFSKLQADMSLKNEQILKVQAEMSFKNEQILKLEQEIALLKATLRDKEQQLLVHQQHEDSLESRLEADLATIRKMEVSASLWQEEKSSLLSSLSVGDKKASELLEQLGLLKQEKVDLSTELQAKILSSEFQQQQLQTLHEQLAESHSKLKNLDEHSSSISKKYDATLLELEGLRLQLLSLQEVNDKLENDLLSRSASVADLAEVVATIRKHNADLEEDLSAKHKSNVLLQQENDQLKEALKAGAREMQVIEEELSKLQQLHLELQNEHGHLTNEKQRSFDEHSLILLRLEKVEKDLTVKQNENSLLETELKHAALQIQDLESTLSRLENERKAASVEIASTVLLMNDLQVRADSLQEEINKLRSELDYSNEHLQQKVGEIQELSCACQALREEKATLNMELESKVQEFSSLEANLRALQDEQLSLVDKCAILTAEVASGTNLIQKLKEDISQLSIEKEAKEHVIILRKADIKRLHEDLSLVHDSEKELRRLLEIKEHMIIELEEKLERIKTALHSVQEEHKKDREKLEVELKGLELVVMSLSEDKVSLSEKHALSLGRCNDLEALCKKLQKQAAELQAESNMLEARLALMDDAKRAALDHEEMVKVMQDRGANKQQEIEQVQSINEDLKEVVRKLESEIDSLKVQLITFQKKNTLLNEELSTKVTLLQELDHSFTNLKEEKIAFEGGFELAVENVALVQAEVDKLFEKIGHLTELSLATGQNLHKMEERISNVQVSNLSLTEEIAALIKKEKSYVIAVKFMRAEFFCLAQRVKAMKEEKAEQARLSELALQAERKKGGESLSNLQQELAFLREETKRQRTIIFDRAEEKREAIRQLCITLDYMQAKNKRLEGVITSTREKIQRRIAATSARRS